MMLMLLTWRLDAIVGSLDWIKRRRLQSVGV